MKIKLFGLLLALCAGGAYAEGSAAGRAYAAGAANGRLPGAALVEVDGFADDKGGIPCGRKAYSSTWHYKFYSASEKSWVLVNACGGLVVNSSAHVPARASAAPRIPLPADVADSAAVLAALKKEGLFKAASTALDRDLYMRASWLPAAGARPEGCYWEVTRAREKAVMDCAGKKRYASPSSAGAAAASVSSKAARGARARDGAAKYYKVLSEAAGGKYRGAELRSVETLAERDGSAKCLVPDDGWAFVYTVPAMQTAVVMGGCKNKTAFLEADMSGRHAAVYSLQKIPGDFKDSGAAAAALPDTCPAGQSTMIMKLRNYKAAAAPVAGHSLVWEISCGSRQHLVDARTGRYLGERAQ